MRDMVKTVSQPHTCIHPNQDCTQGLRAHQTLQTPHLYSGIGFVRIDAPSSVYGRAEQNL